MLCFNVVNRLDNCKYTNIFLPPTNYKKESGYYEYNLACGILFRCNIPQALIWEKKTRQVCIWTRDIMPRACRQTSW